MTKIKNSVKGVSSWLDTTEDRVSELEGKTEEIIYKRDWQTLLAKGQMGNILKFGALFFLSQLLSFAVLTWKHP